VRPKILPRLLIAETIPTPLLPQTLNRSICSMGSTSKKRKADPSERFEGGDKRVKVSLFRVQQKK